MNYARWKDAVFAGRRIIQWLRGKLVCKRYDSIFRHQVWLPMVCGIWFPAFTIGVHWDPSNYARGAISGLKYWVDMAP